MFVEKQNMPREVQHTRLHRGTSIFNARFTSLTSQHSFAISTVPAQLYKANLLKRPILQYFTPEISQTALHCAYKNCIICFNFSLFQPEIKSAGVSRTYKMHINLVEYTYHGQKKGQKFQQDFCKLHKYISRTELTAKSVLKKKICYLCTEHITAKNTNKRR